MLALIVLTSHVGLGGGSIGALASVQVFFVLSGVYMAAVWQVKYCHLSSGAWHFYLNRALRLWPTYILLLLLTWLTYAAL
ncbi:MAG: acyltransferase, partial [Pandoraea sp.]|nr:acyltransferase [Pandoraea sp.]